MVASQGPSGIAFVMVISISATLQAGSAGFQVAAAGTWAAGQETPRKSETCMLLHPGVPFAMHKGTGTPSKANQGVAHVYVNMIISPMRQTYMWAQLDILIVEINKQVDSSCMDSIVLET